MKREKTKSIALSLLLLLFATFVQAQGNKVSLTVTKESLPTALNQVERQSGYYKINYDYNQLSPYKLSLIHI